MRGGRQQALRAYCPNIHTVINNVSCGSGGHNLSSIPTLLHVLTFPSRDCQAIKTSDFCTGSTAPNGVKIIMYKGPLFMF